VCAVALAVPCFGATWTGEISDEACGASHAKMMKEHTALKSERDCTEACIKAGSKYVFVSNGKVYKIANQDESDLAKMAGDSVKLSGDLSGDTITVSKIAREK
jgi:hypothetical protein